MRKIGMLVAVEMEAVLSRYGSAQRMYVKRGYVPDGSGAWYRGKPCTPYDTIYTNDDDLVLYLSKKLR